LDKVIKIQIILNRNKKINNRKEQKIQIIQKLLNLQIKTFKKQFCSLNKPGLYSSILHHVVIVKIYNHNTTNYQLKWVKKLE
jgi:hypothetical protein